MTDSRNGDTGAHQGGPGTEGSGRAEITDIEPAAQARSRRRHPSTWTSLTPVTLLSDHSPDAYSPDVLWRADFEVHADQHADATTSGMWVLAPVVERALRRSLPVFQLGETGAGFHLLNSSRGVVSHDLLCALRLFVLEEQEHARLHALICTSLDITMLDHHWSDRAFRAARRIRGFRAEMLLMGIAELITAQVYGVLARGVGDPTLSRLFARMHEDELRHLDFHAAVLPPHLDRAPTFVLRATSALWFAAALVAILAVAVEHRSLLRACGSGMRAFARNTVAATRVHRSRVFHSGD